MQVLKRNVMIKNLSKTDSEVWHELVKRQTAVAKKRHEDDTIAQLYEQLLIPIEQNVHNLTDAGRDEICYSGLELARRLVKTSTLDKNALTKMRDEITKLYKECLLYTGEHRELRSQKDKENYKMQLKYEGQIELINVLLDM